jgi:hypothetical protein
MIIFITLIGDKCKLSKRIFGSDGKLVDWASVIAFNGLSIRFKSDSILMVGAPSTYGFQVNFQDKIEIEKEINLFWFDKRQNRHDQCLISTKDEFLHK